jgi:hypothetical protein
MRKLTQVVIGILIVCLVLPLKGSSPLVGSGTPQSHNKAAELASDQPPDTTSYARPAVAEDVAPRGRVAIPLLPGVFIVDAVVNNTDPNLTNTDMSNDGETSIAVVCIHGLINTLRY